MNQGIHVHDESSVVHDATVKMPVFWSLHPPGHQAFWKTLIKTQDVPQPDAPVSLSHWGAMPNITWGKVSWGCYNLKGISKFQGLKSEDCSEIIHVAFGVPCASAISPHFVHRSRLTYAFGPSASWNKVGPQIAPVGIKGAPFCRDGWSSHSPTQKHHSNSLPAKASHL